MWINKKIGSLVHREMVFPTGLKQISLPFIEISCKIRLILSF